MILNTNSEGWADMVLDDGHGNVIINCFEYDTETKEVSMYVEDKSYTPPPNSIICGKVLQDVNGNNMTTKKILPDSFIRINTLGSAVEHAGFVFVNGSTQE